MMRRHLESHFHSPGAICGWTNVQKPKAIWAIYCFLLTAIILDTAASPTWAFDVETKLTASDAAIIDFFGVSVAVSGNTAIVGAELKDAAYLFDVPTGNELFKLTASDALTDTLFGASVAISGDLAIVGRYGDTHAGTSSGSAHLFDATTGTELLKLTANDAGARDYFGRSVAISGSVAIVGTQDSAYLFDVDPLSPTFGDQLFKLSAVTDDFGASVAISGSVAIVGASGDNHAGIYSGAAYLFDVDPLSPTFGDELFKLTAGDAAANDFFGVSVGISGNRAIVGALNDDDGGFQSGSAYLFDVGTGDELLKLNASDAAELDYFGRSVAISGDRAIVGAYWSDAPAEDSGSAYVFDVSSGIELSKLTASDGADFDHFGVSVAIDGATAIVGADSDDIYTGAAYLFTPEPSSLFLLALGLLGAGFQRRRRHWSGRAAA